MWFMFWMCVGFVGIVFIAWRMLLAMAFAVMVIFGFVNYHMIRSVTLQSVIGAADVMTGKIPGGTQARWSAAWGFSAMFAIMRFFGVLLGITSN
jgi:hypothetical protein